MLSYAQEPFGTIESSRNELLENFSKSNMPDPEGIRTSAVAIFAQSIEDEEEWRAQIADLDVQIATVRQIVIEAHNEASSATTEEDIDAWIRKSSSAREKMETLKSARREARLRLDRMLDLEVELEKLANDANIYTNLVNKLASQYEAGFRDKTRYEFIQEDLSPALSKYQEVRNEFIDIRNRAYFNLGVISEKNGDLFSAFFYYNDAYRLSTFDCPSDDSSATAESCMRLAAENKMKNILNLKIDSYVK